MKNIVFVLCSFFLTSISLGQHFTHADSLRGFYGSTRNWWDVTKYDLHVKFNLEDSTISGFNDLQYKTLRQGNKMQIDLQEPLVLDSVLLISKHKNGFNNQLFGTRRPYLKDGNAYYIDMEVSRSKELQTVRLYYHGKPQISKRPPWLPGGLIWKKDQLNRPWISIACQGQGASVWYPCKDHQADKPDSAEMHITCPDTLFCVGNGRYRGRTINGDGTATYDWAVINPINNYCIIPYIGKYVSFQENYLGEKGKLDLDYWVLDYDLEKAKKQFLEVPRMLKAFEHWFGAYPFYEDGYKLVDAPHLGMEHQSAIAYGNGYINGYHGTDLSGSGWGLKWDFIIVHESGHEWFANNITTRDIADMWVHEGFTAYSETLFTEYYYGKKAADEYVLGTRKNVDNKSAIIGSYNVNDDPSDRSSDMYYKGANMLHTIRQIINNDEKFRSILKNLNKIFYHNTVTSAQIEASLIKQSALDLSKIFDQYLRTTKIPTFEYKINNGVLFYHWVNCINGFNMPLKIILNNATIFVYPTTTIKTMKIDQSSLKVDQNFYVGEKIME